MTALHIAAKNNYLDLLQVLLPVVEINKQDSNGFSALHYATINRNKEVVSLLLDHGIDVLIKSKVLG